MELLLLLGRAQPKRITADELWGSLSHEHGLVKLPAGLAGCALTFYGASMSDPDSIVIFSPPQIANIREILLERWGARMEDEEDFKVSGALVGTHVTVGLLVMGGAFRYISEASMDHALAECTTEDAALLLLDLLEGYFADYLDADRISQIPLDWADLTYQGKAIQLRGDATRPGLDSAADKLLDENS